ncbi:LysR family transcriptional regulator [Paraburkholderia sp. D15]|uniref:LysR family transcriptional regulator n=1 Tax=Paraburkholderia sp. D15 TaxID=2880218 RepID=UPI0024789E0B|nr:LysR family transcriptional regulator [Paraburkholderia sp. D15]WGS48843.1 LysR family transcriptional regulator [Paraburkholderia sp. D15]WKF56730.1 Glycine cleavage system transcriptional activator [Paraburkholderia busanensis]
MLKQVDVSTNVTDGPSAMAAGDGAPSCPVSFPRREVARRNHLHWDWDAYRYFVVLARCGVMRRAADELGVSVATLSRRIEQLEGELGLCLFQRKPHGLTLTEAGRQVLENCEHISDAFGVLEKRVTGGDAAVMDHVNLAVDSMLCRLLLHALPPFLADNAGITVNLRSFCTHRQEEDDADLTFGFERPERGRRKIRRLADLTMSMAMSNACRDDARASLPVWVFEAGVWQGRQDSGTGSAELTISHLEDVTHLVRNGFGAAMLPDYMIDQQSSLVRFEPPGAAAGALTLPVWMSIPESASRSNAVRSVASICIEAIQARLPLLSHQPFSLSPPLHAGARHGATNREHHHD